MKQTSKLFKNCQLKVFKDNWPLDVGGCDVRIDGQTIIINYTTADKIRVLWRCIENGSGHYICKKEGGCAGDATLHKVQSEYIYEGYRKMQDGSDMTDDMWRITLAELWRNPGSVKKGDMVLISNSTNEDDDWVKCKVTGVGKEHIKTTKFEDIPFSEFGAMWKFPEAK